MHQADLDKLRQPTEFLDHDSPVVRRFVHDALRDEDTTDVQRAVRLYYAVRDGLLYEVYGADLSRSGLRASAIISAGTGFCVHKSLVYAAALRAVGIPSRLIFGDVRNHLASDRLRRLVGGDVFCFHSLTSVFLEGRWLKATPVFNKLLCRLYRIAPLDFDGAADSMYHPFDQDGRRHMEFLHMHGEFDDFPYSTVINGLRTAHPRLFEQEDTLTQGSLVREVHTGGSHD